MRLFFVTIVALCMVQCTCDVEGEVPSCINEKIEAFAADPPCNENAHVNQYFFQEVTVYVFDPGTCGADMASEVVTADCETLGWLGGLVGNTIINGETFSNATFQKTVWKN